MLHCPILLMQTKKIKRSQSHATANRPICTTIPTTHEKLLPTNCTESTLGGQANPPPTPPNKLNSPRLIE